MIAIICLKLLHITIIENSLTTMNGESYSLKLEDRNDCHDILYSEYKTRSNVNSI